MNKRKTKQLRKIFMNKMELMGTNPNEFKNLWRKLKRKYNKNKRKFNYDLSQM